MKYRRYKQEQEKVTAEVSCFGGEGKALEYHIMLHAEADGRSYAEQLTALHGTLDMLLREQLPAGLMPVFRRYFLSDAANQWATLQATLQGQTPCAISVVQQPPLDGSKVALWIYLTSGQNEAYQHHWMAGAGIARGDSERQMRELLEAYESSLEGEGCRLAADCIRTWIFVQNVDVNYAGIVKARRENFVGQGLTEHTHYIASTGIEGRHADPKIHVLLDAYAVKGLNPGQVTYLHALTHLSPTALYGVTFERGTCVEYGDRRHLFISGTASIDHRGEVVHVGDIRAQTYRMWENVEKLLEEGKAGFADVAQMIVYLRDASDYPVVRDMFAERFPQIPIQFVAAAVCRPTWLIEMECMAVAGNDDSGYQSF